MYHRTSEVPEPTRQSVRDTGEPVRATLAEVIGTLGDVVAPTEAIFLDLGQGLSDTVNDLQRIENGFTELGRQIDSPDVSDAIARIELAVSGLADLSANSGRETEGLGRLSNNVAQLVKRLTVLYAVTGEVRILAMNAKIQASQLTDGTADFTVFTAEMGRLADLARNTVGDARSKVAGLVEVIARALAEEESFTRSSAVQLSEMRARLVNGVAMLVQRRHRAAEAAQLVRERSRLASAHVSDCMGRLQINDIATQRIEHVRTALETLDDLLAADGGDDNALAAEVCRLQRAQLDHTASDYTDQVDSLIAALRDIGTDARAIVTEAGAAFSGDDGGATSFAGALEADIDQACRLLDDLVSARGRAGAIMETVHVSVADIVEDLHAVTSIDADMQIMGLNATLKCGRLGSRGQVLGVIAQELRGCSRRVDDNAKSVAALLDEVRQIASALHHTQEGRDQDRFAGPKAAMTAFSSRIERLAAALDGMLAQLRDDGSRAAGTLDAIANRVHVHEDVAKALRDAANRLTTVASGTGEVEDVDAIRDKLKDLLAGRYTMASERQIHHLMAADDGDDAENMAVSQDSIDDCFL
jgi:uncharacterized protein YukE